MISNQDFNDMLDREVESTLAMIQANPTELLPHILCIYADPTCTPRAVKAEALMLMDGIPQEKEAFMAAIANTFVKRFPTATLLAVFMATEAWLSNDQTTQPSLAKDRREIIAINGFAGDGRTNMATVQIGRDRRNGIVPGQVRRTYHNPGSDNVLHNYLLATFWKSYQLIKAIGHPSRAKVH